ncbi:MAG: cytochrome c biogenesis protein CcdA [Actinomycetota bacterium]|nr:cytochrome c biogenesis protein CcdA [Actinomycetota bacterium]
MGDLTLYPLAFAAGAVSFLSPCVLPLLPGYLSYILGSSVRDLNDSPAGQRLSMLYTTILFVAGFSIIFTLMGSALDVVGSFLKDYRGVTQMIAGIIIITMGIFLTGLIKAPALYREIRLNPGRRLGPLSALPLGMAFAVGWTPCIGPILASVYMLALNSPGKGASLLFIYSLGLGLPFIISGVMFARLARTLNWFKNHSIAIHRTSGAILVIIGLLLLTGRWIPLMAPLQRYFQPPI